MGREINPAVNRLREALADSGKRMTRQRATVLDVIEETQGHLHAEELYTLARARDRRISLSTVYRTLALLKDHDLVVERHLDEEHHHYEAKDDREHYHLICSCCGKVVDFDSQQVSQLLRQIGRSYRFQVNRADVEALGVCDACQPPSA
ncbi:MAG: transcriptional repressor [Chloroflexi bacterium]|nr:transcriptional repressor [Chloroflexota bacterium]